MSDLKRVGIICRGLSDPGIRGFNRYLLGLVDGLADKGLELSFLTDQPLAPNHREFLKKHGTIISPMSGKLRRPYLYWEQMTLQKLSQRLGLQVLHAPANQGTPWRPIANCARVVTVHDLITLEAMKKAGITSFLARPWADANWWCSWQSARQAEGWITVSKTSEASILSANLISKERLRAIYNGVDHVRFVEGQSKHSEPISKVPYFLYVGGFEVRKNVTTLVNAFAEWKRRELTNPTCLILVGEGNLEVSETIAHQVFFKSNVSDFELVDLYQGATALINPSFAEGFGLQVIEAMACGTPVICANATSLPEVGGGAALYFDPHRSEELSALLQRLANDHALQAEMKKKSITRAQDFSWKKTAAQTLQAYESARAQLLK